MEIWCAPGYPRLTALLRPRADSSVLQAGDRLTALGRDAIYWAFRGMGYPSGTTVWMPSFHCGVEVQAAIDAGLAPVYYRVKPDLTVDEDDLRAGLGRSPGPVLLIHYFGLPQPQVHRVLDVCRVHRVPLVEDCCHALFSTLGGEALGSIGPVAAFSFRKTMGTVDGGFLRIDARQFGELTGRPFEAAPDGPRAGWPYRALVRRALRARLGALPAALDSRLCSGVPDQDLRNDSSLPVPASRSSRSSWLAEHVLRTARADEVVRRRRANWALLRARLGDPPGCRALHDELPAGVCPLGLVLSADRRDPLMRSLAAVGVEPYVFGASPHPTLDVARFPDAERLRRDLLCLPVHQALSRAQVEHVAASLTSALRADQPGTGPSRVST